jgi:hypothetical protein
VVENLDAQSIFQFRQLASNTRTQAFHRLSKS